MKLEVDIGKRQKPSLCSYDATCRVVSSSVIVALGSIRLNTKHFPWLAGSSGFSTIGFKLDRKNARLAGV